MKDIYEKTKSKKQYILCTNSLYRTLDLLEEKVYPVIAKAIEESGKNLVKD